MHGKCVVIKMLLITGTFVGMSMLMWVCSNCCHACSVCILLEICALGSLADVLRGRHRDGQDDGRGSFVLRRRTAGKENLGDLARLRLCFADLIHLCLGCARYVLPNTLVLSVHFTAALYVYMVCGIPLCLSEDWQGCMISMQICAIGMSNQ